MESCRSHRPGRISHATSRAAELVERDGTHLGYMENDSQNDALASIQNKQDLVLDGLNLNDPNQNAGPGPR